MTSRSHGDGAGGDASDRPTLAEAVVRVVAATAPGEVLTYGEVAAEAGWPGAARAVGRVLRDHPGVLPWWRVVTATGRLVPGAEVEHARALRAEGVALTAAGRVARRARPSSGSAPDA
ncbi:MGMT family protein [Nitriliruptoraceae bacterium ZYF776]|nr:MGMT family protein [Profundirhabdus halotolerans]